MKNIFLSCFLHFVFTFSFAQTTWVQKLNDHSSYNYLHGDDQVTGVKDIAIGADGNIYVLAKLSQDSDERLFKIAPAGHPIYWSIDAGYHSLMTGSFTTRIKATADSGLIMMHNWMGYSTVYHVDGSVEKYDKNGIAQWSASFPADPNHERIVYDAIQRSSGGYWALVDNMSYKLGINGFQLDSSYITGGKIFELPNGDLIVQNQSIGAYRTDTLGNILWNVPSGLSDAITISPSFPFFYLASGSSVKKLSIIDGSVIWVKNYTNSVLSNIDFTSSGGFVASTGMIPTDFFPSMGGATHTFIFCADSTGDTLWTRNSDFPYFGISAIKQYPNGNIILGGGFLIARGFGDNTFQNDYKAFCASIDSFGNGALFNTDYMWPGDANNDQILGFVDDAINMMIANGDSGQMRDTIDMFNCCGTYGVYSDFAFDWANSFANGVNHKYADFNGNGLVDTNDVILFQWLGPWLPDSFNVPAPFRIQYSSNSNSLLPELKLVADYDTVSPGSDVQFYIIAGTQQNPVDSIYGLAFSVYSSWPDATITSTILNDCDLGYRGSNLFTFSYMSSNFTSRSNGLSCRYDHQNAINLFDTLGIVTVHTSSTISSPTSIVLNFANYKAIRWDESPVLFNIINGAVIVDPSYVSVEENQKSLIKVFPNPAIEVVNIASGNLSVKYIEILNSTGQIMKEIFSSEKTIAIPTHDLPAGVYTIAYLSENSMRHYSFAVQH